MINLFKILIFYTYIFFYNIMIDNNYDLIINKKEEFKNKFISITGDFDFFLKIFLTGDIGTNFIYY